MTVYDGSGQGDVYDNAMDADSPRLEDAARNQVYPGTAHNDLRVAPAIVTEYREFLQAAEAALADGPSGRPSGLGGGPASGSARPASASDGLPATGAGSVLAALLLVVALPRRR